MFKDILWVFRYIWRALYSGDGKKILSASEDETIKEWDVESGQCIKIFTGHEDIVIDADYCEDGEKILSLSADQTLKEWNLESGKCLKTFRVPEDILEWAMYCEEEEKILSTSFDDTIKEWNVKRELYLKKTKDTSADLKIEWNLESGKCLKTFRVENILECAMYCEDEEKILSTELKIKVNPRNADERLKRDGNEIKTISRKTGETIRTFINIPGMLIQGCSFKNLHPDSDLSEKSKELLRQYGGKFE